MHRFEVLDSWRGICACMIVLFNVNAFSHAYDVSLIRHAPLFVDFFFVLSGFVICAAYQERLQQGLGVGKFMLFRFARLYPLHITMLAAYVLFELLSGGAFTGEHSVSSIFTNALLIHSLGIHDSMTWNLPAWSVSTLFYTYLIFALALLILREFFWLIMIVVALVGPIAIAGVGDDNMYASYDYGLIRNLYGFALGVFALHVYRHLRKTRDGLGITAAQVTLVEIATIALVVVFVSLAGGKTVSVLGPYLFAVAVIVFAFGEGGLSRRLKARPFMLAGTLSYSIYMVHSFIISRFNDIAGVLEKTFDWTLLTTVNTATGEARMLGAELWQGDLAYVVVVVVVIGASSLTYRFIEEPSRIWFRRLADKL